MKKSIKLLTLLSIMAISANLTAARLYFKNDSDVTLKFNGYSGRKISYVNVKCDQYHITNKECILPRPSDPEVSTINYMMVYDINDIQFKVYSTSYSYLGLNIPGVGTPFSPYYGDVKVEVKDLGSDGYRDAKVYKKNGGSWVLHKTHKLKK